MLAVLDASGIERAVLVGASFGGRVALDLAASRPERIVGLVLAGAGLPDHLWSPEVEAFGAAEDDALDAGDLDRATEVNVDFWLPDAPESVRAAIREQQRDAFALQVGSDAEELLLTDDLTLRLAALEVPALVLVGESDHVDFHADRGPARSDAPAGAEGDDPEGGPSAEPRAARQPSTASLPSCRSSVEGSRSWAAERQTHRQQRRRLARPALERGGALGEQDVEAVDARMAVELARGRNERRRAPVRVVGKVDDLHARVRCDDEPRP